MFHPCRPHDRGRDDGIAQQPGVRDLGGLHAAFCGQSADGFDNIPIRGLVIENLIETVGCRSNGRVVEALEVTVVEVTAVFG